MRFLLRCAVGVWSLIAILFGLVILAAMVAAVMPPVAEVRHESPGVSARVSAPVPVRSR